MHRLHEILPHVNASLNALATVLLIVGYSLIRQRRETAHKWVMLSCFGVSVIFLACYLTSHSVKYALTGDGSTRFPTDAPVAVRYGYYAMLLSHVLLAALVPFLALGTIYFGLRDQRLRHVWLAKITFPVWFYVSITGVIVYLMLYHIYAPRPETRIINPHEPRSKISVAAHRAADCLRDGSGGDCLPNL